MRFNQQEFNQFILENQIIGFFDKPLKLKSGRLSNWYVNWRRINEDVFLINQLSTYVNYYVEKLGLEPNCFYGVPEGATKLGIICQYKWAMAAPNFSKGSHSLPMGRAKPKEHGDPQDRFFLGVPTGKVVLLEDVTTTGLSILNTIDQLQQLPECEIVAAIGLTNRMELRDDEQSVEQAINKKGIPYYALSNAIDLLPAVYEQELPGKEIAQAVEIEFNQYGIKPVRLL